MEGTQRLLENPAALRSFLGLQQSCTPHVGAGGSGKHEHRKLLYI